MNNAERIKRYRLKQKEQGRLKREMYLTSDEFTSLKLRLGEIRGDELNSFTTIITSTAALEGKKV